LTISPHPAKHAREVSTQQLLDARRPAAGTEVIGQVQEAPRLFTTVPDASLVITSTDDSQWRFAGNFSYDYSKAKFISVLTIIKYIL
jgi:hypothetical protein